MKAASTKWNFLNFVVSLVGGSLHRSGSLLFKIYSKKMEFRPQVVDSGRYTNDNMYKVFANDFLKNLVKIILDTKFRFERIAFEGKTPMI